LFFTNGPFPFWVCLTPLEFLFNWFFSRGDTPFLPNVLEDNKVPMSHLGVFELALLPEFLVVVASLRLFRSLSDSLERSMTPPLNGERSGVLGALGDGVILKSCLGRTLLSRTFPWSLARSWRRLRAASITLGIFSSPNLRRRKHQVICINLCKIEYGTFTSYSIHICYNGNGSTMVLLKCRCCFIIIFIIYLLFSLFFI
jgi:hypothetical protein